MLRLIDHITHLRFGNAVCGVCCCGWVCVADGVCVGARVQKQMIFPAHYFAGNAWTQREWYDHNKIIIFFLCYLLVLLARMPRKKKPGHLLPS